MWHDTIKLQKWLCLKITPFLNPPFNLYDKNAREFQEYNFSIASQYILNDFPEETIEDKTILDLGCGDGGKTVYCALNGANKVVGIDPNEEKVLLANELSIEKGCAKKIEFICASGNSIPYNDKTFDLIISSSVMEHISPDDLPRIFNECYRVLKPGGKFLIRYHPYHSRYGAHLLYIPIPWCQFLFHEQALLELFKEIHQKKVLAGKEGLYDTKSVAASKHVWEIANLNRLTVKEFEKVIQKSKFAILTARPNNKGISKFFTKTPFVGKFIINHTVYVLKRPA